MNQYPQAPIEELRLTTDVSGRLLWLIHVKCPLCGQPHNHGGGTDPQPDLGHRGAHCGPFSPGEGYWLTLTDSTKIVADAETKYAAIRRAEALRAAAISR